MGIRKMYKFLNDLELIKDYPTLTKYVHSRKRENPNMPVIICIDFWLYAHKFTYSYGNMLIGFWNQIIKLLSHKIIPLYVYDGRPPQEKDNTIQQRQKKRLNMETKLNTICNELSQEQDEDNNDIDHIKNFEELEKQKQKLKKSIIHIKKHDIDLIKEFFDLLHIPYLTANGEADSLCAKLFKDKYITACLSDDMDMLALGCGRTIKFNDGRVIEFDLHYILSGLQLNYGQFVELCLLFGCDYIKPLFKLDNVESYNMILRYKTIDNILDNAEHEFLNRDYEKCKPFVNGYNSAKNILLYSADNENIPDNFKPKIDKQLDPIAILAFLKAHCHPEYISTNMKKILSSIEYVNFHIAKNSFV